MRIRNLWWITTRKLPLASDECRPSSDRRLIVLLAPYSAVLVIIAQRLSLWVDEILQLLGTRDPEGISGLVRWAALNAGGVPGIYLVQAGIIRILGFSPLSARLPSVATSILACVGMYYLAKRVAGSCPGVPVFAALLFAVWPLQFRYAIEARPYGPALFLSVLACLTVLDVYEKPKRVGITFSVLVVTAAVYTQPFAVLLPASVWLWLVWSRPDCPHRAVWHAGAPLLLAGLAFAPWLAHAKWSEAIVTNRHEFSVAGLPSMLLREFPGSYLLTCLLGLAGLLAWRALKGDKKLSGLLAVMIIVPLAGVVAADMAFGYFLAVRQFIFAIPGVVLGVAVGIRFAVLRSRRLGISIALVVLVACAWQDVRNHTRKREDWQTAAMTLQKITDPATCILIIPESYSPLYEFFNPDIASRMCNARPDRDRVVAAVSPYTRSQDRLELQMLLQARQYREVPSKATEAGGTKIHFFVRPGHHLD